MRHDLRLPQLIRVVQTMGKRKADSGDPTNLNSEICEMLLELAEYEKNVSRQIYKFNAYRKAAATLSKHSKKITNGDEARKLEGIGAKIAEKIDEFLKSGHLQKLDTIRADDSNVAVNELMKVSGIGPVQARKLLNDGIRSIEDLKKHQDRLTHHQKIGLKYCDEFQQRIPRKEMEELDKIIVKCVKNVDERYMVTVCGSYRRGRPNSGDIDILLTHDDYASSTVDKDKSAALLTKVVEALKKCKFVTDVISQGDVKFMGVCQLPSANDRNPNLHRRIDIRMIPKGEYWCGVLYFTGSDQFNRSMRQKANEAGFTINEYSIRKLGSTGLPGESLPVSSEQDVFDYIGMDYVEPEDRNM